MISKTIFESTIYKQTGHYCVLASYGVASIPFLSPKVDVIDFFLAFCNHYQITANTYNAEELYLKRFIEEYNKPGMTGYKVINELHNYSSNELFNKCRQTFLLLPKLISKEIVEIENELINYKTCLMIFIHKSSDTKITADMHSVIVFYDDGFWIYDVNEGKSKKIKSINSLGQLGESFLIKKV